MSGFELSVSVVKDLVSKSEKIVSGKNTTLPVLSSIYFKVKNKRLTVTSFDLKTGYIYTHNDELEVEDIDFVIPLKEFSSLVKNLNNESNLSFSKIGSKVNIKSGLFDFNISLLNESDYPAIDLNNNCEENSILLNQEDFVKCFSSSYCASKDVARVLLTTLMIKNENNKMVYFSTDGHRMVYGEKELTSGSFVGDNTVCIPKQFVEFVLKCVKDTDQQEIKLIFKKDIVSVGLGNVFVFSRLIDGEQLDPNMIVSQMEDIKYSVVFEKQKLSEVMKVFSDANTNKKPVLVKVEGTNFSLSLEDEKISGNIQVEGETILDKTSENICFGINSDYVLGALEHIYQDDVCVSLIDEQSPIFFYGRNETDKHVIMPVRV